MEGKLPDCVMRRPDSIRLQLDSLVVLHCSVDHVELVDSAALPNPHTYEVDGASPNPKMQEVLAADGEVVDVNKPIDLSILPSWREQLTFRALFLGCILGGVFCIM